jgi:hypothetical protein
MLLLGVLGACDAGQPKAEGTSAAPPVPRAAVIDSALPVDTLLRRFRATVADTPTVLAAGAESPEALTRALFAALEANDSTAARALAITPGEFAWLYYPHTKWTRPPYEMGPALVWLQLGAASDKGLVRLMRRYGGRPLRLDSLLCPDTAVTEGPNAVLEGCLVRFAVPDSAVRARRIFGSLLRRDGRYKFVSYSNDL